MNVDADIDQPDLNLSTSTPKLHAGLNSPDIDVHGPNVDFKGPRQTLLFQILTSLLENKMPNLKMPIWCLGPK